MPFQLLKEINCYNTIKKYLMINIAIIIDDISSEAGTERAVTSLSNGLLKFYPESYNIEIISIFSNEKDHPFFKLNSSIKVTHLDKKNDFSLFSKFFWYLDLIKILKKYTAKNHYDVILGTTHVHNILLPILVSNKTTKIIGCEHVIYMFPSFFIRKIRDVFYKKLDSVVVLNQQEKDNFNKLTNTHIITNSLPFESTLKSSQNSKKIIAVGRLAPEKGFTDMIEIFGEISEKFSEWTLDIYGKGSEKDSLNKLIEDKNLSKQIKINDCVDDISVFYISSSIFAQTSYIDSFGLALVEAMHSGLGVISYANPGAKNLIKDNKNGFLIPLHDKQKFKEQLTLLMENHDLRINLANEAVSYTNQFKEINIIPLWNDHIQFLLKGKV